MDRNFPCKKCYHSAFKHYSNVPLDTYICLACADGGQMSWTEINEHLHEFEGDNLKYMELKNKKKEILDG